LPHEVDRGASRGSSCPVGAYYDVQGGLMCIMGRCLQQCTSWSFEYRGYSREVKGGFSLSVDTDSVVRRGPSHS